MPLYPADDLYPSDDLYPDTGLVEAARDFRAEWLLMLPPILRDDPWIQAIFGALAEEMRRLIRWAETCATGLIPPTANEYTLPMWEALVGLPIQPTNAEEESRVNQVLARMLRGDGSGQQWEAMMTAATLGSYRYAEHDSGDPRAPWYTLVIDTALPPGITVEVLRKYVREITPANLSYGVGGGQTYRMARDRHPDYDAARDGYLDYDNMRFVIA